MRNVFFSYKTTVQKYSFFSSSNRWKRILSEEKSRHFRKFFLKKSPSANPSPLLKVFVWKYRSLLFLVHPLIKSFSLYAHVCVNLYDVCKYVLQGLSIFDWLCFCVSVGFMVSLSVCECQSVCLVSDFGLEVPFRCVRGVGWGHVPVLVVELQSILLVGRSGWVVIGHDLQTVPGVLVFRLVLPGKIKWGGVEKKPFVLKHKVGQTSHCLSGSEERIFKTHSVHKTGLCEYFYRISELWKHNKSSPLDCMRTEWVLVPHTVTYDEESRL